MDSAMFSVEAEQSLIGGVMLSEAAWDEVCSIVAADDFVCQEHQAVWEAFLRLTDKNQPRDALTVAENLKQFDSIDAAGGLQYLGEIVRNTASVSNIKAYAQIVADRAQLRRFAQAFKQGEMDIANPEMTLSEKLSSISERMEQAIAGRLASEEPRDAKQAGRAWLDMLDTRFKAGTKITGLHTGFPDFDNAIRGLNKKHMLVLAARPGMGKTTLATNIIRNVLHAGHSVFLATMEMSTEDVMTQLCCAHTGCDYELMQSAAMGNEEVRTAALVFATALTGWKITIDDRGSQTIATIRRGMKRHMRRYGNDALLVVDYAQLISHKAESEVVRVGEISRSMKELAQDMDIPIILISQLSRACDDRPDRRPLLSDLRGSGSLEQDASEVAFLYDDAVYNPNSSAAAYTELLIAKNRHGKRGIVLPLLKQLNKARFLSPDRQEMPHEWRAMGNVKPLRRAEPT